MVFIPSVICHLSVSLISIFCSLNAKVSMSIGVLQLRAQWTRWLQKTASLLHDDRIHWSLSQLILRLELLVWRWHESWKTHALITSRWRWLPIASQIRDRVSFSKYQVASEYFLFLIHSLPLWYPHFSQHYLVLPLGSKCPHLPDDPPVCHLPSSAPSILNFSTCPMLDESSPWPRTSQWWQHS